MDNNDHLFNAAVVGENPDTAFIVEGNRLHAVEKSVAERKKESSEPKKVLPLLRNALKALIAYSEGKVEGHFLDIDWTAYENKPNEQSQLIWKINQIYGHLPHHDHNELCSMIHHKQAK